MNQIPTEEQLQSILELLPVPLDFDEILNACLRIGPECLITNDSGRLGSLIARSHGIDTRTCIIPLQARTEGMFAAFLMPLWLMTISFLIFEKRIGRDPFINDPVPDIDGLRYRYRNYADFYFKDNPEERILIEDKDAVKRLIASRVLKKPLN